MEIFRKYNGVFIGIFTLLITFILKNNPGLTDALYSNGIYPLIRSVFDVILSVFPFSLLLLFILLILFLLVLNIRKRSIIRILNLTGWLIAAFYWLWGFNYFKSSLTEKLNLKVVGIQPEQRITLTENALENAILLSNRLTLEAPVQKAELNFEIIQSCNAFSSQINGITPTKTVPVAMFPKSLFLRIGITGMYFPFTGQAHYEPLLGNISRPFTIAHEWYHAAGVAPESEANFLAYISLVNSKSDELKYAAEMNLLIELLIYYKLTEPEKYQFYRDRFTDKMDTDLKNRNALYQRYANAVSKQSDVVINQYLKMQNQQGTVDYHRLADWVVAWKKNAK